MNIVRDANSRKQCSACLLSDLVCEREEKKEIDEINKHREITSCSSSNIYYNHRMYFISLLNKQRSRSTTIKKRRNKKN